MTHFRSGGGINILSAVNLEIESVTKILLDDMEERYAVLGQFPVDNGHMLPI